MLDGDWSSDVCSSDLRRIFNVLGSVGGKQMIPFFRECFNQSNPLKRAKVDEARALAAYMLGVLGDTDSRRELEKRAAGKLSGGFMKWACNQAIGMLDGAIPTSRATRTSMPPALDAMFATEPAADPARQSAAPELAAEPEAVIDNSGAEAPSRSSAASVPNLDALLADFITKERPDDPDAK
jgi:hypothetical protein